ncbi:uncharacterized protein K444DRAFT_534143 [Hyaloscypha bicolor E]|uniref:CFEM domain-containing protein n=1 Tax=Hyaloscypha bicolor E TaxID=1095630 RepID=A0A2J6T238_9HELO|nr:uncharacterized protein K444DRAFT_534143 [Hyaloscypha bicolor E]PMD57088.1 hypothetical protein K444DRAFT_534143 [Hyaloscypha bicolor E]
MKFSILAVASMLACIVYSQSIQGDVAQLPSCSLACLSNAVVNAGCSITDYACQCGSLRPTIASQATPCIVKACNTTEALNAQKIGQEICSIQAAAASSSGVLTATTSNGAATTPAVSNLGSTIGSAVDATTTTSLPTSTIQTASTSSSPATASKAAGTRLEAAGAMAGAVVLVAFAL